MKNEQCSMVLIDPITNDQFPFVPPKGVAYEP